MSNQPVHLNTTLVKTGGCRKHLYFGHPSEPPTLKELDYLNPGKNQTTIRQHLQQLVGAGILEEAFF
ncbi:helix-turn-helix domain-containing protein [Halorubrum miltondacostae]|uniref:helix-turn-helix domain-containing protein n=1 Tax=Halorubrum miltondacostae TaxID=3076378 RepID=UPI0035275BAA